MSCPGYCGDCLRPDWRFGIPGQRQYSMELRERASSTPRQTPNLSTSPFSSNDARTTAPVMGRCTRSEGVHCLRIGCSAPNHKNKRGICETTADTTARGRTRYGARHPLWAAAPVMSRCTRYEPLHPLWAAAPDQKGCNAYGSGAAPPITRTNAESARRRPTQQREGAPVTGRDTRYGPLHPL